MENVEIKRFANKIRRNIVKMIAQKGGGHIGGSLSVADLLAVLYGEVMQYRSWEPEWEGRDYLVCSKGHAGPALYSALALKGFFPMEWLNELNVGGTRLPGHCDRLKVPGIDATTGSLGQGLSIAAGIAHGLKVQKKNQFVYCIVGDGESDEGQIWEAAAYAPHYKLSHLLAFTDWNKQQIDGTNDRVMKLGDLSEKYRAFGWNSSIINGGDITAIEQSIYAAQSSISDRPTMIILDTIKGAGITCIEEMEHNHCIGLPMELYEQCITELNHSEKSILGGS